MKRIIGISPNAKISMTLFTLLFSFSLGILHGQEVQTFANAGFKIKCGCKLIVNTTFIQMAQQQGTDNILAAYVCIENESIPEKAVIYHVNVYDLAKSYTNHQPSAQALFEKQVLDQYANNLRASGISMNRTTFQGVAAIEYSFDQMNLPTKAIIFLKNKKMYAIQAGTRSNLSTKFSTFKTSFSLL